MAEDETAEDESAEDETTKSWWLTLPGIITGIGSAIVALTGLVTVLYQAGLLGSGQDSTRAETATSAEIRTERDTGLPPLSSRRGCSPCWD